MGKQRKFRASDFDGSVLLIQKAGKTTHISDGCWIAPISAVKNAARFESVDSVRETFHDLTGDMVKVVDHKLMSVAMRGASPPFVEFMVTGWTYRSGRVSDFVSVAFLSADGGACFLAERYVKRFRIKEVYCTIDEQGAPYFAVCFPSEPQNWPEFDLALMPVDLGGSGSWLFKQIRKVKKGKANG